MSAKRSLIMVVIFCSLVSILITPTFAVNLDDGYPKDSAAPGRTCPMTDEGTRILSEHSGKNLVCTLITGVKKWWIEGEAIPTLESTPVPTHSSGVSSTNPPEIQYTPKYKITVKALAKMKVLNNIPYATQSPSQRLDIYLPKGVVNPPLLIWTHGGGFVFGDEDAIKYDESAKLLEAFVKNGVAVASVNYRLAQEAMFPAAGIDAKSAIRFLRANASKYGYDPKKFATGGDSAGAYLALMTAITGNQSSPFDNSNDPNAKISAAVSTVIDLFGNADFFEMALNKIKYPCDESKNPYPDVVSGNIHPWFGDVTDPKVQAAMKSGGLYPYIKRSKALPSLYIFHGTDDCSVSPQDSKNLDKSMKGVKGKSALVLIPGAIHGGAGVWTAVMKAVPAIKKSIVSQ